MECGMEVANGDRDDQQREQLDESLLSKRSELVVREKCFDAFHVPHMCHALLHTRYVNSWI